MIRSKLAFNISIVAAVMCAVALVFPPVANAAVKDDITGLWNTGVDATGAKLPTDALDPHWSLVSVDDPDNGQPNCQNGPFPRNAYVTGSNVVYSTSTAWPYSPTNANWIGPRANGLNDTSGACTDPSYAGGQGTADQTTWPYWNFAASDFTIPATVDLSTVTLTLSGLSDNSAEVKVNGHTVLTMANGQSNSPGPVPVTSTPLSGVFKYGANTLTVRLKSGFSRTGFVLSELIAGGKYLPKLTIAKSASANTFAVGASGSYTVVVKGTGGAEYSDTSGTVTMTDVIPNNFTLGTMPAGCTAAGQTVTCTTNTVLKADGSNQWDIVIPVTAKTVAKGINNTASVTGGNSQCVAPTSCESSVSVDILAKVPNTGFAGFIQNPWVIVAIGSLTAAATWFLLRRRSAVAQRVSNK